MSRYQLGLGQLVTFFKRRYPTFLPTQCLHKAGLLAGIASIPRLDQTVDQWATQYLQQQRRDLEWLRNVLIDATREARTFPVQCFGRHTKTAILVKVSRRNSKNIVLHLRFEGYKSCIRERVTYTPSTQRFNHPVRLLALILPTVLDQYLKEPALTLLIAEYAEAPVVGGVCKATFAHVM